jgi:hypothetical protein
VEGRVQVCEELEWRFLCDSNWTVQDAAVACRSLNYSAKSKFKISAQGKLPFHRYSLAFLSLGALNISVQQGSADSSSYEVLCVGSEDSLADCQNDSIDLTGECGSAISVKCFISDGKSDLESNCVEPNIVSTTGPLTTGTKGPAQTSSVVTASTTSSPPSSTDPEPGTISTDTSTTQVRTTNLTAPILYYTIGSGLSGIMLLASLITVILLIYCYCHKERKNPAAKGSEDTQVPLEPVYETISCHNKGNCLPSAKACREGGTHKHSEKPAYSCAKTHHVDCSANPAYMTHGRPDYPMCAEQPSQNTYEVIPE